MAAALALVPGSSYIYRLRLPLPFALNHVHCYLLKGEEGWSVIDAGMNTEPSRQQWAWAMRELGLSWRDVKAIYITHCHPDHYGAAGWLQEQAGAPVFMLAQGAEEAARLWDQKWRARFLEQYYTLLRRHGVPAKLLAKIAQQRTDIFQANPLPAVTRLQEGEKVHLGGREWEILWTSGHADGHMCLFNRREGLLLSGDHLLPTISSNISLWPGTAPHPLQRFLDSLEKIKPLPVRLVLPAHGLPFSYMRRRVDELLKHHRERLELMAGLAATPVTAYEISRQVFGDSLSVHEMRFAVAETLAHLDHLIKESLLEEISSDGVTYYTQRAKN